jgi:predicted aspartyl protease
MRSRRAITKANALLIFLLGASALVRSQQPEDELTEIVVRAPEPRFVAPTRRDKIGRIWAPVLINGKGPFRLVLDTGANHSAITTPVALALGVAPDPSKQVLLRGVTGNAIVPTVRVDSFAVGDVILTSATLPIIADALGGAEGVLGTDGFAGMRIYIDFKHDLITIARSHDERVPADFVSLTLNRSPANLLITRAQVDELRVHAIIDTGAQATIGNEAMRLALMRRHSHGTANYVIDVTSTSQDAQSYPSPPIQLGAITIQGARITYGDMHIFEHWHLIKEPAVLIGMDVIGLLDVFIVDYRRHEIQLRPRRSY